ncbi:hypothetical protein D6I95_08405 [Alcaligenes faecalis]|nr:hypothetical protein D6I95_08405 [Alcaligenes faecalis]
MSIHWAFCNQQSTINNQQSTINNQQSTINNQQSTINNQLENSYFVLSSPQLVSFLPNDAACTSCSHSQRGAQHKDKTRTDRPRQRQ